MSKPHRQTDRPAAGHAAGAFFMAFALAVLAVLATVAPEPAAAQTNNPPTVANAIPDQSATAGTAFSYVFPANTFSDADTGDTLTYTATKADDTALPTWLAFAAGTRTFSGTPQAADTRTVSVKVIASDGNGGSVSDEFDITVVISVPSNWTLKPTALATGDKFRLLFLSSTKRDGSSSDIADYHAFIQTRAAAGHADIRSYSTGFRAVGCTADTDARDTTYTTYTSTDKGVPIYWLNGAKAADQYEDFYDGTWDDEVNDKNESGTNGPNTSLEANYPLTGCNDRGTEYFSRSNMSSALAKIEVMVGRPNSSGVEHGPLSSNTALDVANTVTRPMYGLSAVFEVVPETTPPTLTSADVDETNGLTIYLEFSEDLQLSNPPLASAFTLTVDGSAVTGFSVAWPGASLPQNAIWLGPPTAIRQGQAVVVTYTDPTADNDTAAIQDTTGNDAADFTTGMNSVPAVINNSTVANAVLAGWSLTPTGLAVGDQFRLLFLSSTKRDAAATDIATYNTFIQTRAAAGHTDIQAYSAGFRVVGCTAATDARDNTETTYTGTAKGVAIYWLDGAKAADEYEDFYDGTWDDEANDKNESGTDAHDTSQTANWPWTGCNHNGTEFRQFAGTVSRGLGSNNDVRYGRPDSSTVDHGPLNGLQNGPKAENRPLYGLSALFQVADAPDTTPPTLTSADVEITDALIINLVFSEDLQLSNPPALSAFTVTVDGSAATVSSVGVPGSVLPQNELWLQLSTAIRQRQAVVVTYTDATSGDDTAAIQDTAGNDAATFTTGMDGVPAVTNNSTVTNTVPADWSLIPTGLSTGDKFRLLFLSSTKRNSTATNIATYNTFIQTRAAAGHTDIRAYSAGFRAVGCTAAVDARDNTATTYTTTDKGVPIYWLNGAKAADQYEDFYDGSWDDEANDKNESGTNGPDTSQNNNLPVTGCSHDGTELTTFGSSRALGASQVSVGRPNSSGSGRGPLFADALIESGFSRPMYGLSGVFQVAAAVVVPNNPPTVATAIPDQSATAGTAFSYVFPANTFSDADTGDTLSYTATKTDATALPTWLAFTAGTRTFAGTPQAADAGTVAVKVTASDGNGGSVSDTFDITVAADTTPPTLTSVEVLAFGNILQWRFSENLNVQPGNLPPFSAFTVTADGRALTTNTVVRIPGVVDGFLLQLSSPFILQGQTVVVTYTDPTAGDDANAIQDTAGNDAATFTTGMNGVPAVTNNSTVTNTPATGAPTITGTAQVGQTLTAGTTAIMDADGLTSVSYTYQWIRTATGVDTNISGATASTYTLVAADLGTTVKVRVSFTDDASNAETLTSAATAAVSANNPPTSSNKNLALNEDTELTFFASDFPFTDADGNSLSSVKILSLPATDKGTLTFSGMALTSGDLPQTVPAAQFNSLKYVPPANENGGAIPFTSFTFRVNDGTDDSAATYTLSLFVHRVNDAATGQPGITGTAQVGQTLAATAGTIADVDGLPDPFLTDTNTSFQWVRVTSGTDADISGARDSTYTLVADDEGKKIKVKVSFLDTEASTNQTEGPLTSAATATVSASTNTPATGAPTITGTAQVGQTLTAGTTAIMDADGLTTPGYTYQWIRTAAGVDTNISGATASTYTLVAADLGTTIKVRVSFTDDASNAETLTSAATAAVSADTTPPTLTSAEVDVLEGRGVDLEFSENLQRFNPPPASAFTVTVDGSAVTVSSVGVPGSLVPQNQLFLTVSPVIITQGQAVVVSYTDPTTGDDASAIQDAAGNDAAAFTTGSDGVPAVTNASPVVPAAAEVPADWSLKPTAVTAGTQFRLLFLSSTKRDNASSTDIADYNTFVQGRAAAGHADIRTYSAGFRAVGCTADTDARDNTYTTYTSTDKGVPIYWLNGAKAADEYEDFYDGSWDDEANDKNESGTNGPNTSLGENHPVTGCDHDGTEAFNSGNFSQALGAASVRLGQPNRSDSGDGPLSNTGTVGHNSQNHIPRLMYGLSAVFQVAATVVVPNNPPAFSADTAARSVAENTAAGQNVGAALTATDADSDTLTYTLEGTDAASFDIVSGSGQIRTRTGVTYNHEAKSTHTVVVKADDGNGGTDTVTVTIAVTDVDEPPGQPAAPSVSATAGSTTSLDVTWTAPTNTGPAIASYDVQYRAGTSGNFTDGPQNVTGTSAAIGSLAADTSYEVQVRATNAEGDGDWSVAGTGRTTATSAPGAPTGLSATASGATQIDLSWTAPGSTGGSAITGYKIEVSPNGTSGWTDQVANTNSTATTYEHTGLDAGTTRHYRVSAINANGAGTASNVDSATTDATVPGAPTGLTATASGATQINLSWSAPGSTGGSAITGYKIEVSANGTSGWTDQVANTNSTATTYEHTGLDAGTTRHYRVSAINANGAGTASNVDSATTDATVPGAPTGLTATASGATQIDLSWTAPGSTGGSAITGYKIEVSANGTSGWTDQVADTNSTATTYAHTGLAAGDTRHYRVSAINTNGAGVPSNVDSATTGTTVPGAPTGLTATASGTTAINLSWTAPASTGGSAITGYKIEVSPNGTSGWTDQVANTNSTATTYAHTGLGGGDTRHYRVSAINTNGAGTASDVANATTDATAPGAPTGLTATASGTTAIDLSWSAPGSTGGSAITGYKIEVSPNGTSGWTDQVANTNSTATTYAHTGLTAGDTRHYRVSAINTNGTGVPSNVANATTGTSAPGAPTGLTATASGTTAIDLSWSAPGSTGGSAITGYKIESSSDGGSSWSDLVANTSNTTTTYAHTGLAAGDTRHYRVSAINTNGAGTASNVDSATTDATAPGAPTGLTATASGTTAIDLSWSAPGSTGGSAITGYKIESSSDGGSSWSDLVANTSNTATAYAHTGLAAGDTRHYRVSAINANGTGTASNVDSATTDATVPGAPIGLTATASGATAINLSWTAPASTGGSAITGYKIEVSPNGTSSWTDQVANTNSTATTYAHTGLAAGDTRHYRVSAINTNGAGVPSNVANATTGQTTVTFGASSYTAAEGGATATVAVQLSAAASATVTIPLTKTHRGGATAADYSGVPSNVTFTAGQTRRTFTVTATDDADKDGGESVQLGFGSLPDGYAPGARRTATVTLVDDDANLIVNFGTERHTTVKVLESDTVWHRFIFSLSTSRDGPPNGNPQQPVTIPLVVTHRGGATTADYEVRGRRTLTSVTFRVGESVTDFFMRAIPDGTRETGEGLRLDFGPLPAGVRAGTWGPYETVEFVDQVLPGYTVLFGAEAYTATEGGAPARVSIHLSEPVEIEPAEVRLVVTHVGATEADYEGIPESVTFAVGKQTMTFTVTATDDAVDDDGESVTLSFVNDPNGRVRVRSEPSSTTVALLDDDGAKRVEVSFGAVTYTATEGGSDATVSVELDAAPGRSVTVPLTKAHLGGTTPTDYSGIPTSVTFGASETAMTFAVTATAGDGSDGGESVSIGFGTLPEGVFAGSPAATTVTLADGTEQRLVVDFGSSRGHTVEVREGARRLRLNVLLDSSPRRPVTIPLVVKHVGGATEADYADIPESVTFAVGQTSSHYYVQALPDEEDETGEGLRLDFGPLPPGVRKGTWGPYETIEFVDAGPAANLSVSGTAVTVGYPGALDGGSTPSPRDFVVSAEAPGGEKAMVPVAAVSVRGSDVFLELARPALAEETVTLSYLADAMHPIRDAAGRPAAPLTDAPVRNDTGASGLLPEAALAAGTAIPAPMAVLPEEASGGAETERLDLSSRNLTDVTALAGLTGLRELDLRNNAVEDLWPLAGLTGLKVLYLSGNRIEDLTPLAGLTRLKVLDLAGNRIGELWPLAGLTALERLNLADNAVEDLTPLAGLIGLRVLLLDRNRITDVLALSPLAGLANLGLSGNRIEDIWPLAGLGRLRRLDLSGNAVADVSALGDVSGLVWLRLLGNPVSNALPLERLEKLRWLWLDPGTAAVMEAGAPPDGRGAVPQSIELAPVQ